MPAHLIYIIFISIFIFPASAFAENSIVTAKDNILTKLPYNIKIGITNFRDLQAASECRGKTETMSLHKRNYWYSPFNRETVVEEKVKRDTGPCEEYLINNKFTVYLSADGTIVKLGFYPDDLPSKWRKLGLKQKITEKELTEIIKKTGIDKIDRFENEPGNINIEFSAGGNRYSFRYYTELETLDFIAVTIDY